MTATDYQQDLFGSVTVTRERLTAEESFAQFRRRNPWFMPAVARLAYRDKVDRGHVSVKRIFEELRAEVHEGSPFRLNNTWTSLCARLLIEQYPDLDGCVELRKRVSV